VSTCNCLRTSFRFLPMRTNLALFAFLAITGNACGDSTGSANLCAPSGAAATVSAGDNLAFTPSSVTIAVGQSVCWQNTGNMTHIVTEAVNPGQIPLFSSNLPSGQAYVYKFNISGSFNYRCNQHSNMTGTVIVN
jgi:plastocyanin